MPLDSLIIFFIIPQVFNYCFVECLPPDQKPILAPWTCRSRQKHINNNDGRSVSEDGFSDPFLFSNLDVTEMSDSFIAIAHQEHQEKTYHP